MLPPLEALAVLCSVLHRRVFIGYNMCGGFVEPIEELKQELAAAKKACGRPIRVIAAEARCATRTVLRTLGGRAPDDPDTLARILVAMRVTKTKSKRVFRLAYPRHAAGMGLNVS